MRLDVNTGAFTGNGRVSESTGKGAVIKNALMKAELSQGQVFRGRIQDIVGNNVKIHLGDGQTLLATMENGVNFNIGENVNFLVKSNDGSKILLQSVQTEGQGQLGQNLLNYLEQSGLELNEKNIAMVKEMMAYSMAIDSESLGKMERLIAGFPGADISSLVAMKSHDIPVNQENIEQFQAYKTYEHKLSDAVTQLTEELGKLVEDNTPGTERLTGKLLAVISELTRQADGEEDGRVSLVSRQDTESAANTQASARDTVQNAVQDGQTAKETMPSGDSKSVTDSAVEAQPLEQSTGAEQAGRQAETLTETRLPEDTAWEMKAQTESEQATKGAGEKQAAVPNDGGQSERVNAGGQAQPAEQTVMEAVQEKPEFSNADKLKEALKELKNRWLLEPDSLEGKSSEEIKDKIRNTYEELSKGVEKLMETLKESGMEKTDAFKAADNIKSNIQFMNDLNHMAAYVQIPLKTAEGEGNGELYVYNRNKNKSLKDGPITAFLHFDLEHLGATDIKVTMDRSRVTTNFILADTISQDIVEENLPLLKARLEKLGYTAEITVEPAEQTEQISTFDRILEVDRPRNSVKRYGFDIRL